MSVLLDLLIRAAYVVLVLLLFYPLIWGAPILLDSRFTGDGVDLIILGGLTIFRLKRANIREAVIVRRGGWIIKLGFEPREYDSKMSVRILTRRTDKAILIKTTGLMWWYFSP
jgi:hypothetical protein